SNQWPGDIDAAFNFLLAQRGVDKNRIGAAGASCGVNQSIQLALLHPQVKSLVLLSGNTDTAGRQFLRTADGLPIFAAASDDDFNAVPLMRWILAFSHNPQNKFAQFKAAGHGTEMFAVEKGLEPMIVEWFDKTLRNAPAKMPAASTSARKPSPQEEFWSLLEESGGAARAMQYYEETKKRDPNMVLFPEFAVNALGYERLQAAKAAEAVEIFKINVAAYPASPNVYDSLGDAYVAAGKRELAIETSRKTIQMLESTPNLDAEFRKLLRESAEGKLRQLGAPIAAPSTPQPPPAPPPAPPADQVFRMPIVYSVPGMDTVAVRRDVVYKTVDSAGAKLELKMDVYSPAGAQSGQRFPAVLLISGGGADPAMDWRVAVVYQSYGRLLAASGFVGIPFTKRYQRGVEGVTQGASDLADIIRYVREHSAGLNVNPDRMAVWAFSAGGFLLSSALRDAPPYIRAVLSFYAVLDVIPGGRSLEEEQRLADLSPLTNLRRSAGRVAPILIARAGLDNAELNAGIERFVQEARARNLSIELMEHPQGRHGFDVLDDNARSREIIARAIEFLKARLAQ
ncbi:MAG: prolyl oligopeptidase family serine peptidase, partial [Acidobacteria bacterium]|nr:prolyl oligopeptidase family serine peptidase [Acidobacteriota bacterium]